MNYSLPFTSPETTIGQASGQPKMGCLTWEFILDTKRLSYLVTVDGITYSVQSMKLVLKLLAEQEDPLLNYYRFAR